MLLTNCQIVGPAGVFSGTLETANGTISQLSEGPTQAKDSIDCDGHFLFPGCVELHTDNLEKHLQPRGSRWPSLPALIAHDAQVAALGITTVLNAICIGVDSDLHGLPRDFVADCILALNQAKSARLLRADHLLHLRCELPHPETPARLQAVLANPDLRLVSLMDHTPGQRQVTDLARLRRGYERMGPVSDDWFNAHVQTEIDKQQRYAEPNRRQLVDMLRDTRIPTASHDDASEAHIAECQRDGITISEFPTTLEAARAARAAGIQNIMGAPNVILGGSQSGNLAALEAARHGLVDALSSDYAPVSLLHAVFHLSRELDLPLHQTASWISARPAAMANLTDRGQLAPGLRADIVEVALIDDTPCVVRVWKAGQRVA
jgi:alpha-D-ribose 1-methylphosphonate 5-triphosphate diphosphatase